MSKKEFNTLLHAKIPIQETGDKDPTPELTEELRENVEGIMIVVTICDVVPWLILTAVLLALSSPLAPVGLVPITLAIHRFLKNFQKLEQMFKD